MVKKKTIDGRARGGAHRCAHVRVHVQTHSLGLMATTTTTKKTTTITIWANQGFDTPSRHWSFNTASASACFQSSINTVSVWYQCGIKAMPACHHGFILMTTRISYDVNGVLRASNAMLSPHCIQLAKFICFLSGTSPRKCFSRLWRLGGTMELPKLSACLQGCCLHAWWQQRKE